MAAMSSGRLVRLPRTLREPRVQGSALDQLHREKDGAVVLSRVMDGDDVGMGEPREPTTR
jgi:hypothetical protein